MYIVDIDIDIDIDIISTMMLHILCKIWLCLWYTLESAESKGLSHTKQLWILHKKKTKEPKSHQHFQNDTQKHWMTKHNFDGLLVTHTNSY